MKAAYGLILAGGRGTRFWPRSRRRRSKQVLSFFGEHTLIQQTVQRLAPILPPDRIWILTNEHLRQEIIRQLPLVPKEQILAEPAQRNTAPAIGLAAHLIHSIDPKAVMGVFPADHYITRPRRFLRMIRPAYRAAARDSLVVLGIEPRWPETGYGYIEFAPGFEPGSTKPVPVLSFREKPKIAVARRYVAAGCFTWNAGMFFGRAATFLRELREHLPKTAAILGSLPPLRDKRFARALSEVFPLCEDISIDYAVMERSRKVLGLACDDIGWNDVGSWNAVYELHQRDANGNAARVSALFESSSGNYVDAEGKLVALLGVKDLVVVDTPTALLITTRQRAQEVGTVVKLLEQQHRDDLL